MTMSTYRRYSLATALFSGFLLCGRFEVVCSQPGVGQRFLESYQTTAIQGDDTATSKNITIIKEQGHVDDGDSVSASDFFGVFQTLGTSWHTILHMFRGIVNSAGGETHPDDVQVDTLKEEREWLYQEKDWKDSLKDYAILFGDLDSTTDDVLNSFLHWASVDETTDGKCHLKGGVNAKETRINVSRAKRRLERYENWMATVAEDLKDLTAMSLKNTFPVFGMKLTIDGCQLLVWWLDLAAFDWDSFRDLNPKDIARTFVWMSHYMMLHPNAQQYGLVFVNSLNQIGFWPFMQMLPLDLGMQLDEFLISIIPVKTKFVVLMERPSWAKFAYQLLRPFLQAKMRRRVAVIEKGQHPPGYLYEVVGKGSVPEGIQSYPGSKKADIIHAYLLGKGRSWKPSTLFSNKK